jgi:LytS/YehU family sensor histidine kinase
MTPDDERHISALKAVLALAAANFPASTDVEIIVNGKARASIWMPSYILQMLIDNSPT